MERAQHIVPNPLPPGKPAVNKQYRFEDRLPITYDQNQTVSAILPGPENCEFTSALDLLNLAPSEAPPSHPSAPDSIIANT